MYHTVYPQMIYALNPQESIVPGSTQISLYNGIQFLSLANSQDNQHLVNNAMSMAGNSMSTPSPVYSQNNLVFNHGNILTNQQQTNNVLAISSTNNLISLANSLESNHASIGNNQYSPDMLPTFNQTSQCINQNYNGMNKQCGHAHKEKKYPFNRQNGYNNKYNNHKNQNMAGCNSSERQHNQNKHNGSNRSENHNHSNNNYQQHNRNFYNSSSNKRNWSWQNKHRSQNQNFQNLECTSSASSSSSARVSSVSPAPGDTKVHTNKADIEDAVILQPNTPVTPRKSPTLGEFMLKTLITKDRHTKHSPKNMDCKQNNAVPLLLNSKDNSIPGGAAISCCINESWPNHYSFINQQAYFNNKSFRINQFQENKQTNSSNQHMVNGYHNQHKKRESPNNSKTMVGVRDHRFGVCYQRTRRFHITLSKDQMQETDKMKSIGNSVPYSLHNLYDLYIYYNLVPFEYLPYYPRNFFVPADRFLVKSSTAIVADDRNSNIYDSATDKVSRAIWKKYISVQQSKETYRSKLMLWKYLFLFIKNFHPRYSLFLVGSTMTGFASNSSDVDFCLIVKNAEIDQRNEAHMHLEILFKLILHSAEDYFKDIRLFPAKVPILRFHDSVQELDVDLNCNNFVGIRNTHLLHCYSQMDWRLRPLVVIVKQWARGNQMNSARESTISSYSLTLMVIHYLQSGVYPPILPCLHAMYPGKYENFNDIHAIDIHEKLEPYVTDNKQSLGDLLLGFFEYYSRFDYTTYAISVRLAKLVKIENCKHEPMPKNDPGQWMYICIEEPFDRTNTARSVYLYNMFLYIKSVFQLSYKKLKQTRDLERIMDLELSVPDNLSTVPFTKGISIQKPEPKKTKIRNGFYLSNEMTVSKVELAGC